jgi:hypothetical protein
MVSRARLREYARYALNIWGETMQARQPDERPYRALSGFNAHDPERDTPPLFIPPVVQSTGLMYPRNVMSGVYRPADDPEPAAFLFLQVERALDALDLAETVDPNKPVWPHRAYAFHRYAMNRGTDAVLNGRARDNAIMALLIEQMRTRSAETIVEVLLVDIRVMNMRKQRERNAERMAECRDRVAA